MKKDVKRNQVAFRCHNCAAATVGFIGGLASHTDMLRLKCECGGSALEIKRQKDGKLHLSVPCVYCKEDHGYNLSPDILSRDVATKLSCPFSGMDIFFVADESELPAVLEKSEKELASVLNSFDADELGDIHPKDVGEAEAAPDPAIFDTINFLVRDLEAEGKISCPCGRGKFGLRFCDEGMEVYCEECGAAYVFHASSTSSAEEYLTIDSITLR